MNQFVFLFIHLGASNLSVVVLSIPLLPMMVSDLYYYLSDLPRWHIFAVFLVGYFVYYLIEVVKVSRNSPLVSSVNRTMWKILPNLDKIFKFSLVFSLFQMDCSSSVFIVSDSMKTLFCRSHFAHCTYFTHIIVYDSYDIFAIVRMIFLFCFITFFPHFEYIATDFGCRRGAIQAVFVEKCSHVTIEILADILVL